MDGQPLLLAFSGESRGTVQNRGQAVPLRSHLGQLGVEAVPGWEPKYLRRIAKPQTREAAMTLDPSKLWFGLLREAVQRAQ